MPYYIFCDVFTIPAPSFLGAFDAKEIAFVSFNEIKEFFTSTISTETLPRPNHQTKEFRMLYGKVKDILEQKTFIVEMKKAK